MRINNWKLEKWSQVVFCSLYNISFTCHNKCTRLYSVLLKFIINLEPINDTLFGNRDMQM